MLKMKNLGKINVLNGIFVTFQSFQAGDGWRWLAPPVIGNRSPNKGRIVHRGLRSLIIISPRPAPASPGQQALVRRQPAAAASGSLPHDDQPGRLGRALAVGRH